MKKPLLISVITSLLLLMLGAMPALASGPVTRSYGAITKPFESEDVWDLTACDLTLSYRIDLSAYTPRKQTLWTAVGVTGGALGWMSAGAPAAYSTQANTYEPDDQFVLTTPGKYGEKTYNALSPTRLGKLAVDDPTINHGIWFDRDGIGEADAQQWGALDGQTYNTQGVYDVEIIYHAIDNRTGTMFATVNGVETGFYQSARSGTPDLMPIGKSLSGNLQKLWVWVSVQGRGVRVSDLTVNGCQSIHYVEMDFLPGYESNCFAAASGDLLPLVLFGSKSFNVSSVNARTLELQGFDVGAHGKSYRVRAAYINEDRYPDLVVEIRDADKQFKVGEAYVNLVGQMWDGMQFEASDKVCVVE